MSLSSVTPNVSYRAGFALFAFGFRPFFLLAGISAAAAVPLWILVQQGFLSIDSHLGAALWHGHEMIFGFGIAVVAGFLLTATAHWTGQQTASGPALAGLAGLWLAGRVMLLAGTAVPASVAIAADVALLPLLALVLLRPILQARNHRNLAFPGILFVLGATNLGIHLGALGVVELDPSRVLRAAVDLIVLMIVVIGGRVVPAFTRTVVARPAAIWQNQIVDRVAIGATVLLTIADLAVASGPIAGVPALVAALANGMRMVGWRSFATRRMPILWILHVGYAWVVLGFGLRALAELTGLVTHDPALHALTAGAIGTTTLGMMSRVALGHTGRRLVVTRPVVVAYALVLLAGLARVAAPLTPSWADALLIGSGVLWSVAFLVFTVVYTPILIRPRADGRPG